MNWRDADARGPVPNSVAAGRATSLPCIIIIRWPQPVTATAAMTARAATNAVRIFMTSSCVSGLLPGRRGVPSAMSQGSGQGGAED